jgi:hypothetical protein
MPTVITQTQTGYDEDSDSSGDDVMPTTSVTLFAGNSDNMTAGLQGVPEKDVRFPALTRRFVQVSLEGNRIYQTAKVKVRCHLRKKKIVSKAIMSKVAKGGAKANIEARKVSSAGKKKFASVARTAVPVVVGDPSDQQSALTDPNYTATVKLVRQLQFNDLMEWRRITFKK